MMSSLSIRPADTDPYINAFIIGATQHAGVKPNDFCQKNSLDGNDRVVQERFNDFTFDVRKFPTDFTDMALPIPGITNTSSLHLPRFSNFIDQC